MRFFLGVTLLFALACAAPTTTSAVRIDGVWRLTSAPFTPVQPRTLTLQQQGTTITGTGTAMGVDAPLPLTVAGTIQDTVLDLQLGYASTGEDLGRITAVVMVPGQLAGRVTVNAAFGGGADSATYIRQ